MRVEVIKGQAVCRLSIMANNRLNKKIGCLNIFLYFDVHLSQVCLVRIPTFPLFRTVKAFAWFNTLPLPISNRGSISSQELGDPPPRLYLPMAVEA